MLIGVVYFGLGLVSSGVCGSWWQTCQMSDSETIEVEHVMKELEVKDLVNGNITRTGLIKHKKRWGGTCRR